MTESLLYLSAPDHDTDAFIRTLSSPSSLCREDDPHRIISKLLSDDHWQLLLIDHSAVHYFGSDECRKLTRTASNHQITSLMVGTSRDADQQLLAIELGCQDSIDSPFVDTLVRCKLNTYSKIRTLNEQLNAQTTRQLQLNQVQEAAILCMAHMTRLRDKSTGNHTLRCQFFVKALAEQLRQQPGYAEELKDDDTIELLCKSAALHDIGKVGVPDNILQKPGSLTAAEYEAMKQHTWYGYQALVDAEKLLQPEQSDAAVTFLNFGKEITLCHHERWDGRGYPRGLKGSQIPLAARIMSVADVYDAVTSNRPYQHERSHQVAVNIIREGRNKQFDPAVADAFLAQADHFAKTSLQLMKQFPSLEAKLHCEEEILH